MEKIRENLIVDIMAYEAGELTEHEVVNLFSELIKSGVAWSLQGHYGRTASMLIEGGLINEDGTINHENY